MQIKRFEAATMSEALETVKQTFGADAVILSARNIAPANGLLRAWKKPKVEVTAAIDVPQRQVQGATEERYAAEAPKNAPVPEPHHPNRQPAQPAPSAARQIQEYARPAVGTGPAAIYPKSYLKNLFLLNQMMRLHEVAEETRISLITQTHRFAVARNQMHREDLEAILRALVEQQMTGAASPANRGNNLQTVALIGPTGKGKTTTLAKLAAVEARRYRRRVGLISLDNSRIGGIAQLRIFARIIGVPLLVARNREEFQTALQKLRPLDKILIDTPGFNPRERGQIEHLARLLNAAQPLDVHLVCSATTKEGDLRENLRQLEGIAVNHMIFSKLDESMTLGTVLTHMLQGPLPVSYLSTGPRVPEDIQRASAPVILDRIINPQTERQVWAASPETLAEQREGFERMLLAHQPTLAPYQSFSQTTPQPQGAAAPPVHGKSFMI